MQRSRNAVEAGYQTRPFQSDQSGHQSSRKELKGNLLQGIQNLFKRNKFLLNRNNRVKQHISRLLRCSRFILITNRLFRYYYLIGRSKFSFCRKIR